MQPKPYPEPPDDRRCTHVYADGRRCRAYAGRNEQRQCAGHAGIQAFTPETAREAQARSAEARRKRRLAREVLSYDPSRVFTPDDVLRLRAAERAAELADLMLAPLDDPDLSAKTRAEHAAWIADRARPDLRPDVLAAITLERARAQLRAAPDPRRALETMSTEELEAIVDAEAIEVAS